MPQGTSFLGDCFMGWGGAGEGLGQLSLEKRKYKWDVTADFGKLKDCVQQWRSSAFCCSREGKQELQWGSRGGLRKGLPSSDSYLQMGW